MEWTILNFTCEQLFFKVKMSKKLKYFCLLITNKNNEGTGMEFTAISQIQRRLSNKRVDGRGVENKL